MNKRGMEATKAESLAYSMVVRPATSLARSMTKWFAQRL